MKVIITTEFKVRDNTHSSYYSFPVYSDHIEETLIRELEFLKRMDGDRKLNLEVLLHD